MNMKKTKVMYQGRNKRGMYIAHTRLQIFVYRLKKVIRIAILCLAIYGIYTGYRYVTAPVNYTAEAKVVTIDNLTVKIDELKHNVVTGIQHCESQGHDEDEGIIIFDTNNKASVGTLQFQKSTVVSYYKKFYGKDITPKNAVIIALDNQQAEQLAYDIVFKEKDGWKNWYNCGRKTNVEGQLAIINNLEK